MLQLFLLTWSYISSYLGFTVLGIRNSVRMTTCRCCRAWSRPRGQWSRDREVLSDDSMKLSPSKFVFQKNAYEKSTLEVTSELIRAGALRPISSWMIS